MATGEKEIHVKPKEILELEEMLGVSAAAYPMVLNDDAILFGSFFYVYDKDSIIRGLHIESIKIESLHFLEDFKSLTHLHLSDNNISNIEIISILEQLVSLDLSNNKIRDVSPINNLKLESLSLDSNPIEDSELIKRLVNLKELSIGNSGLENIDFLEDVSKLSSLFIVGNKIESLDVLKNKSLERLWAQFNKIKFIPYEIAKKSRWLDNEGFNIDYLFDNNPLEFPPYSVINQGPNVIKSYYEDAEQYNHSALLEGRIIFIGDGSSGKTSLINKVLYNDFDAKREQTNGIKIEHFTLQDPEDNRDLSFHVWDFGGQEIQHAVHKFFFSEGCLYVLVLDNRKEEDPEYWLQQIETLGGKAPVLVVFNKHDQNNAETADRKYLKEKYPNIVGFFNTSCASGFGMADFKTAFEKEAVQLRTINERFPNNWLAIKKAIEEHTSGNQHYLTFETYQAICAQNNTQNEKAQKLILQYLNTIGAVTWFGDDVHLNMLHVLRPEWITQGVYKIITAKKTAHLFGQIQVNDFKELLQPLAANDYTYEEKHYAFLLNTMDRFELCYTTDRKKLLIPSAFGKTPKVEYRDFKGNGVRTYFLQFKHYMPLALIHRFITRNLHEAVDKNYWYTGIVMQDTMSNTIAMVHADREAKRIYIRIKGELPLGLWEHTRRLLADITDSYAKIPYDEMILLDEKTDSAVKYNDVVAFLKAGKYEYFHPVLGRDFKVKELLGMFEEAALTIEKIENGQIKLNDRHKKEIKEVPQYVVNILNDIRPQTSTTINNTVNIDVQIVNEISNELQGELNYLLSITDEQNKVLLEALQELIKFSNDAAESEDASEMTKKGWKRKLKPLMETVGKSAETIKKVKEGGEALGGIYKYVKQLAKHFKLKDVQDYIDSLHM